MPRSVALTVLTNLGIDPEAVRNDIDRTVLRGTRTQPAGPDLPYTSRAKKAIELAMTEARELDHAQLGSEHLLLGLSREHGGIAAHLLTAHGAALDRLRAEVLRVLTADSPAAQPAARSAELPEPGPSPVAVTVTVEYHDGRLSATRFTQAADAIAHIAKLSMRT